MKRITTIKGCQSGWIVCFGNDVDNFHVFKSNEPERLVKFLCDQVAGIRLDQVVEARKAEIEAKSKEMFG